VPCRPDYITIDTTDRCFAGAGDFLQQRLDNGSLCVVRVDLQREAFTGLIRRAIELTFNIGCHGGTPARRFNRRSG